MKSTKPNSVCGSSGMARARFWPDMLLQYEDMELLSSHPRDLSRLLMRSLFGCGVVCGLAVKSNKDKNWFTVGPGVALTDSGDPILVPSDQTLSLSDENPLPVGTPLWVVLYRTVKNREPRAGACYEDESVRPTKECYGFELRIQSEPPECGCTAPSDFKPNDKPPSTDWKCVDPSNPLYHDHYAGRCTDDLDEGRDCDCVVLAKLEKDGSGWKVDHRFRRFVRPVLMRDPLDDPGYPPKDKPPSSGMGMDPPRPAAGENQDLAARIMAELLPKLQDEIDTRVNKALQDQLAAVLESEGPARNMNQVEPAAAAPAPTPVPKRNRNNPRRAN